MNMHYAHISRNASQYRALLI